MKTLEKYLFNILATSLGFILFPLPRTLAFRNSFMFNWWFSSRFEWSISIATKIICAMGLKKIHDERIEEIANVIWNKPVRKETNEAVKNQPKEFFVSLEEVLIQTEKAIEKIQ